MRARLRTPADRGRILLGALLVIAVVVVAYIVFVRQRTVEARVEIPTAVATLGAGANATPVGAEGQILDWLPAPKQGSLPALPTAALPKSGRLGGSMLEQAIVLGAAPAALRPHIEKSYLGESGVDVVLRSGIELRFGDASQVAQKWRAAAAVLADPSVTSLDYVDLNAPGRPAVGGSGHTLPASP